MDYFKMYSDVWNFHKRFSNVNDTDEFWEAVMRESEQLADKYDRNDFVVDMIKAVLGDLERRGKKLMQEKAQKAN